MNTKASLDNNQTLSSLEEGGETSSPGYHHADPFLYRILEEEAKRMRRLLERNTWDFGSEDSLLSMII